MHEPIGSASNTRHTAAESRTTDTLRSPTRRKRGGADMERTLCGATRPVDPNWRLSAYGHNRRTARCFVGTLAGIAHLVGQPHGLFDQRLDDLRFGHRLDHFTANEDLAFAISRRDAEVGFTGLARTVDDAAHHGDPQRHV